MTDEGLTMLYNEANGITGKRLPITTERIFTAMRAAMAKEQSNNNLMNLLALIHRDGGHHVQAVGLEQALVDAEQVLYKWRGAYDVLVQHNADVTGAARHGQKPKPQEIEK